MNPIQAENANPGTSNWTLTNPATAREIEGYASLTSVNIGSDIDFFVSTNDSSFTLEIFRTGWYGGQGASLLLTEPNIAGQFQGPDPNPDPITGLVECNWRSSYALTVPTDWVSGIFVARLTGNNSQKQSYIVFVVRDDARKSDLVFQSSVTTFQAYNFWPGGANGKSLYDFAPGGRAQKVSFNRPYVLGFSYSSQTPGTARGLGAGEYLTNIQPGPAQGYPIYPAGFEYNMVRWLEKNGYDITYITNIDLHENGSVLLNHMGYLSVGHNEYWSMEMRNSVETALSSGVHLGFFSSNTMYWQVRLESGADGNANRTLVCYKSTPDPVSQTNPELTTVKWRDAPVNRPEAALLGVEYIGDPVMAAPMVIANAFHWLMNGTGLKNGDSLAGMLGYEVDAFVPGVSPAGTEILATSPVGPFPQDNDFPPGVSATASSTCDSNVVWYSTGKASVFATGTMGWSWALDDYNAPDLRPAFSNASAQQITQNLLASFINPITITMPSVLLAATRGKQYQLTLSCLGGTAPYTWAASGLSSGLNLSSSGVLGGTPQRRGKIHFTVTVTDANQQTASAHFTLPVQRHSTTPSALSINFVGQATAMAPTETAGVIPKSNWNDALGNSRATPLALCDESGTVNGTVLTWSSDNPWSTDISDLPGDYRMMRGYLDTGGGNPTTINVSGLMSCPTGYDIYVYFDGDNASATRTATYSISGPGITTTAITAFDNANTEFNGSFTQASASAGNYVKFTAIHATSFSLTAQPNPSDPIPRAPVNAIQIIPSPAA
jgi:hypothetical protein